jgi:hypothetical protein
MDECGALEHYSGHHFEVAKERAQATVCFVIAKLAEVWMYDPRYYSQNNRAN